MSSSSTTTNCKIESVTVDASDGPKLHTRLFKPKHEHQRQHSVDGSELVVVLVHPFSVLGGFQGLLKGIAIGLASNGYTSVTFDMRGAGKSTGKASLTGFAEVKDVVAVCQFVVENLGAKRILLVGSSAGAPIAGSAVDQIEQVVGYVSLGYPFGLTASILFGRHHKNILQSPKPKLFVMGTRDGFTSVKQLNNKVSSAAGQNEIHLIEGVSHFQMEGADYDAQMVSLILNFISKL
ncbi:unnamed protein product [Rhodiola kirilowii]